MTSGEDNIDTFIPAPAGIQVSERPDPSIHWDETLINTLAEKPPIASL